MKRITDRTPAYGKGKRFYWTRTLDDRYPIVIWHLSRKVGLYWFDVTVCSDLREIELSNRKVPARRLRDAHREIMRIGE